MIKLNMAQCRKCLDVLESKHRHDFKRCSCGSVYIDGGTDYLKRGGSLKDILELSIVLEKEDD